MINFFLVLLFSPLIRTPESLLPSRFTAGAVACDTFDTTQTSTKKSFARSLFALLLLVDVAAPRRVFPVKRCEKSKVEAGKKELLLCFSQYQYVDRHKNTNFMISESLTRFSFRHVFSQKRRRKET